MLPDYGSNDKCVKYQHCDKRNQMNIQHMKNSIIAVKFEGCSFWRSVRHYPDTCESVMISFISGLLSLEVSFELAMQLEMEPKVLKEERLIDILF